MNQKEKLFSYGTLQQEAVQLSTFGRILNGKKDILYGFRLEKIKINDLAIVIKSGEEFHPILIHSKNIADEVEGVVFDITAEELRQADEYEVADYERVSVRLQSQINAWIYIKNI